MPSEKALRAAREWILGRGYVCNSSTLCDACWGESLALAALLESDPPDFRGRQHRATAEACAGRFRREHGTLTYEGTAYGECMSVRDSPPPALEGSDGE